MVCNQSPGMIDWLLELGAARVARPVLRGGGGSDATSLPNQLLILSSPPSMPESPHNFARSASAVEACHGRLNTVGAA